MKRGWRGREDKTTSLFRRVTSPPITSANGSNQQFSRQSNHPHVLADRFVICVLWKKRPFVAPAGKIHCAVKKLQLSPGESNQLLWLCMKSVKEIRIEEFVGEIERVSL